MLSDPNKNLTPAEIRLGKGQKIKTLTKKENKHEKILLGDLYRDKEFLRWNSYYYYKLVSPLFSCFRSIFTRSEDAEYLKDLSEEGFLFLTSRSEFWRNQKPIYVTLAEKNGQK